MSQDEKKFDYTIVDSLKKATTEMMLLHVLQERPMYTYEIMKKIEEYSDGILAYNTMYIAIYRLKEKGFILESQKTATDSNRTRVYYAITETGIAYLHGLQKQYQQVTAAIHAVMSHHSPDS